MTPKIRVQRIDGFDAAIALPSYETAGAAGADIRANLALADREKGLTLAPGSRALVPTGLRVAIPAGYEIKVRP